MIFPSTTGTSRDPDNFRARWRDERDVPGGPDVILDHNGLLCLGIQSRGFGPGYPGNMCRVARQTPDSSTRGAGVHCREGRALVTDHFQHIAVVGAGYMGGGIAQVLATAGFDVVIFDADSAGDQARLIEYRNAAYAKLGQLLRDLGPAPR